MRVPLTHPRLPPELAGAARLRPRAPSPRPRFNAPATLALLGLVVLLVLLGGIDREGRALRALSPEQRSALVARTVEELQRSCGPGRPSALAGHCRELAEFVDRFRECAGPCQDLVRHELTPLPRR